VFVAVVRWRLFGTPAKGLLVGWFRTWGCPLLAHPAKLSLRLLCFGIAMLGLICDCWKFAARRPSELYAGALAWRWLRRWFVCRGGHRLRGTTASGH